MQLLGKDYFGQRENGDVVSEGYNEAGLDALCRAVTESGSRSLPQWAKKALGFLKNYKKQILASASVLVIGFAVYFNWALYQKRAAEDDLAMPSAVGTEVKEGGTSISDVSATAPENGSDDYFAVSMINRQRARDEAIEVLQDVVDGSSNLSEVRDGALAEIAKIAADIENEAAIESLVKGKGFEACVAVISGDTANVIVRSSALLPNEVTQIQEIVYETAGILPTNVKIIEK